MPSTGVARIGYQVSLLEKTLIKIKGKTA